MKKVFPIILLVILAILAIGIRQCKNNKTNGKSISTQSPNSNITQRISPRNNRTQNDRGLDRDPNRLFYTKHARCRMGCRHISQREVEDILVQGTINYSKSELGNPRGPKYAVEGNTADGQKVRIIFSPNTQHISVVTVIDLVEDFACSCQ